MQQASEPVRLQQVLDRLTQLEERVETLEAEKASLEDVNDRLREKLRDRKHAQNGHSPGEDVSLQDRKHQDGTHIEWDSENIENAMLVNAEGTKYPLGARLKKAGEEIDDLYGRVRDIERGEIDPGELLAEQATVDPSELMPLHQMYSTATNLSPEQHDLTNNQEIAARLFPYLPDKADLHEGMFRLRTPKVTQTIERELGSDPDLARRLDVVGPNSNTCRRVMEFIAKFSDGMIEFVTDDGKTNYLTWSRDDWLQYEEHVEEATLGGDEEGG